MKSRHAARRWFALGLVVSAGISLVGCAAIAPDVPVPVPTVTAQAQTPEVSTTVLATADAPALAMEASRAFFAGAPLAVVAPADDSASELRAASVAVALGVPLLLAGGAATPDLLAQEFGRLGTETVLAFGDVAGLVPGLEPDPADGEAQDRDVEQEVDVEALAFDGGDVRAGQTSDGDGPVVADVSLGTEADVPAVAPHVVPAPADAASLGALIGVELGTTEPVAPGGEVAALSALDPLAPTLLEIEGSPEPEPAPTASQAAEPQEGPVLPVLADTVRIDGVSVLSDGTPAQAAAVGTARAAGAVVLAVPGGDPRASSDVIAELAVSKPATVVALGPAFGSQDALTWRVATAATGVELPGGSQLVFEGKRYVALYGTPGSGALGVLGEQGTPETIARARQHAAAIQPFTEDVAVPSLEIIASIASRGAGPDGDYSNTRPVAELRPLVDAAWEAGVYVVLDLQPGRTDFVTQAKLYEELLRLPHVGLALDPEWRLAPNQRHLVQIGSVGVDEVNQVVDYLATLTRDNRLPQKLFILHQFRLSMVRDRDRLDTSRTELAMMIHVDGQGSQPAKNNTWNVLRDGAPDVYWGWKNFYDEDVPMLTPEQTMRIQPVPHLVSYQ